MQVRDLVRQFGAFTAVDHVSFEVARGEIFGLLGPNGAGKTTTFRMLCGLLPASGGTLRVAGVDLRRARASARQRIGYVAQKFSLYGQLSVARESRVLRQRLRAARRRKRERIAWALRQFELDALTRAAERPAARRLQAAPGDGGGAAARAGDPVSRRADQRRRSAGAARILAADHRARRAGRHRRSSRRTSWKKRNIATASRSWMRGRVLAQGTPAEIRSRARGDRGQAPTMEDAFIAIVEAARADAAGCRGRHDARQSAASQAPGAPKLRAVVR